MSKSRTFRWIVLIAAMAALGYFGWHRFHARRPDGPTRKNRRRRPAVRVTIAPVEKADFPVYLTGLGTVQGFNTVVVRTRVDGQIDKIAFQEGQLVKQGDLLVEIDPRPFQASLDQAKAKKAQDEANLQCQSRPSTLHQTRRIRDQAANRHPALHRGAVDRADRGGRMRRSSTPRPSSTIPPSRRRSRAWRACARSISATSSSLDPDRDRDDRPDRTDRRDFHLAGRAITLYKRGSSDAPLKVIAITTDGKKPLAEGALSVVNNQVDYHQRHYSSQGGIRQQRPRIVAGPVGLDAASGKDTEGCDGDSGRRGPARHRGPLCLYRQFG